MGNCLNSYSTKVVANQSSHTHSGNLFFFEVHFLVGFFIVLVEFFFLFSGVDFVAIVLCLFGE